MDTMAFQERKTSISAFGYKRATSCGQGTPQKTGP